MRKFTLTKLPTTYGTRYTYGGYKISGVESNYFRLHTGVVSLEFSRLKDAIAWVDKNAKA